MSKANEYAVRLFLSWLNERYRRSFAPALQDGGLWLATDAEAGDLAIEAAELYEAPDAWRERCSELEARLDDTRPGSYLLWQPPGGALPGEEPDESEWVRRVVLTASKLASGRSGEVRLPAKLALGKVRDEGGYASVTGGLGRHWTDISTHLQGSFFLDSRGLHRFTKDQEEREQLYEQIGLLSQGLKTGDIIEFEHEDAWTLQRLSRGAAGEGMTDGWAIVGCPPGFEPADGGAIRRLLRRRLSDAADALRGVTDASRVLVLLGAYDYIDMENAGPSLRGFDPALAALFDVIALVSDGEVKALRLARGLPFLREGVAS
jgi:hypothetical protein